MICTSEFGCSHRLEEVLDPSELQLQEVVSCQGGSWELNLGPLEEQYMLLITDPSFQKLVFLCCLYFPRHRRYVVTHIVTSAGPLSLADFILYDDSMGLFLNYYYFMIFVIILLVRVQAGQHQPSQLLKRKMFEFNALFAQVMEEQRLCPVGGQAWQGCPIFLWQAYFLRGRSWESKPCENILGSNPWQSHQGSETGKGSQ